MKQLDVTSEKIYSSDDYDTQPETVHIEWDEAYVEDAKKLLAENIWVDKVTFSEGVNFDVDEAYEGKPRGGDITVSRYGDVWFKFFNGWTDTIYSVEL